MASKKPQHPVEVPRTGVRRDVNPLIRTPEMASEGTNCIYYDGAIRPRPALTSEIAEEGGILFPEFKLWLDGTGLTPQSFEQAVTTDDGYTLVSVTDNTFHLSVDFGETWTATAVNHPGAAITYLAEENGFLFAFTLNALYRAPVSTLPASLTWTNVVSTSPGGFSASKHYYDAANDAWLVLGDVAGLLKSPKVTAVYDASTGSVTSSTLSTGQLIGDYRARFEAGGWIDEKWLVFGVDDLSGNQSLIAMSLEWVSTEYVLATWPDAQILPLITDTYNPLGLADVSNSVCGQAPLDAPSSNEVMFVCLATAGDSHICSAQLDGSGWVPGAEYVSRSAIQKSYRVYDYMQSGGRMMYIINGTSSTSVFPSLFVSADNGRTWIATEKEDDIGYSYQQLRMSSNANLDLHLMVGYIPSQLGGSIPEHGELWRLPTGGLSESSSLDGDLSSMIQLDLDEEDDSIIVGTTKALMRLDIATNEWDRITADQDQTVDTGAAGTWIETGDIPPLSVHEDDTEYVSGVTIDSLYGENPWVFRAVEAQGKTFLVGTNGQCYPICYHEDMPGGFARRLGEMTPADPNYLASVDGLPAGYLTTGNLAPKAKCVATGANRLLLGNMVGGSPYGVEVSGFNDHDRGWGLEQFTLLGDTQGPIVSMNEISALSVALYKTDAIYHAVAQTEFLGVAAPFRFELAKAGISGPCSPASVLKNFDGRHIYLARDGGVYMYDSVAPIDGGRNIRRMIQGKLNHNELGKVWGMVDPMRKLVWFFYPTEGGLVNEGLVISTDQGYPWPAWPIKLPRGWNFTTGGAATLTDDVAIGDIGRLGDFTDETLSSFSTGEKAMMMGLKDNTWLKQKWYDDGDYSDSGAPIQIDLECGWLTPGGVQINRADELYHIFSSPDPEQELEVRLKAQQIGQNIRYSKWSDLSAGKLRRRTRHRVSGVQFAMQMRGGIRRIFNWAGGMLTITKTGDR